MAESFSNSEGIVLVNGLVETIHENRAYLSEIDGRIGDGDHGINMDKGFQLAADRLEEGMNMADGFKTIGRTLLMEIGGAMGPLYGQFFKTMARTIKDAEDINAELFAEMLSSAYGSILDLGNAKPGDKTLVDTLDPAVSTIKKAVEDGKDFCEALDAMLEAAETGWKSTEDMLAKIGRSSRLGERSRGVLDAGATSSYLMLKSLTENAKKLLGC